MVGDQYIVLGVAMSKDIKNIPADTPVLELLSCAYSPETGPVIAITNEFSELAPETQLAALNSYSSILRIYKERIEDGLENSNFLLDSVIRRH
jgi:hypothetical protein